MGYYDIDHNKVVWEGLPVNERTPVRFAWLKALVSPAKYIYKLFAKFRSATNYNLAHNGQVCHLETVLNDVFDRTYRRIKVVDSPIHYPLYIYLEPELKAVPIELASEIGSGIMPPPLLDPTALWKDSELEDINAMFLVLVPTALVFSEIRMSALIDEYRLVSKNKYTIVTV